MGELGPKALQETNGQAGEFAISISNISIIIVWDYQQLNLHRPLAKPNLYE